MSGLLRQSVYEPFAVSGIIKCGSIWNLRLRKFAPCKGEIPLEQIVDLCEGCISLSNAEGFENGLLYFADIILTQ